MNREEKERLERRRRMLARERGEVPPTPPPASKQQPERERPAPERSAPSTLPPKEQGAAAAPAATLRPISPILRRRQRRRRIAVVLVVLIIAAVMAVGSGLLGTSIAMLGDMTDSISLYLNRAGAGWPANTGIRTPTQVEPLAGGFVEMDNEDVAVYSAYGAKIRTIQPGYARPALAAGKSRFVLYNRSGNELRVESRTQNLYTKTMDSTISLCAVADAGQVAVVTDSTDSVAKLPVYNSSMQQQVVWNLTSEQGTPLRMAFAPDSRRLAVAAVSAVGGQLTTNLYVLPLSQGDPVCLGSENSVPQWMGWMSNGFLLVLYENRAVLYNTSGGSAGERASYDFGGGTLVSVSNTSNGAALLLSNGQTSTAVLLDGELTVGYSGSVLSASQIIRAKNDGFYLLTDSTVERFNNVGEFQWSQPLSARPRALIEGRQVMVFTGNTVQVVTPPEQTASSGQ